VSLFSCFLLPPQWGRQLYFAVVVFIFFLFLSFFPHLFSPYFHTWCGLSANLECRSEMRCTRLAENRGCKNSPSGHHRTTLSGYIFATETYIDSRKKNLNSNISSTCPHNMVNFGPLTAEIGWRVSGTAANFNGFRILASWRHSTEANHILHNVWPSPGLVHYIYIFRGSCPWRKFARCKIHFVSKSCILSYWQHYCTALEQWASAKLCFIQQWAPPIFSRAAITLGIGPHSYYHC